MSTYMIRVVYKEQPNKGYNVGTDREGIWSDGFLPQNTALFDSIIDAEARRDLLVRREYQGYDATLTVLERLYI
tara:strand:- start:38845 stop:39066 length:222 start_codon:yes stop_codon:yes gene_type:complete